MAASLVSIQSPRTTVHNGVHRVAAQVGSKEVWFESADLSLMPSIEAFGSAFLIASLHQRAHVDLTSPACPVWQQNVQAAVALVGRWWELPLLQPKCESLPAPKVARAHGTALCFTSGLDSFHSLLRGEHRPTFLVFVHGYDIPLGDLPRFRSVVASLTLIARQTGAIPVTVSTNLREHPLMEGAPWNKTHGGALAAIGHLLSGHVSRMIVASSVPRTYQIPWGSHWELDPLWSSGALHIVHDGDSFSREEKAWAIAAEPLLTRHLRVCWENRTPTGNCSTCDKCVNTMLLLRQAGQLDHYTVFDKPKSFVPLLDALPRTTFVRVYGAMCRRGLAPDEAAAVHRLLERTERLAKPSPFGKRVSRILDRAFRRRRATMS